MTEAEKVADPIDGMKRWNEMSWQERYEQMRDECDALREHACRAIIQLAEQNDALRRDILRAKEADRGEGRAHDQ